MMMIATQGRDRTTAAKKQGMSRQGGFSLLEVLVAITILTVGLLALASMQTRAVSSNTFGGQLTEATFLAQDMAENLRFLNENWLANPASAEPAALVDTQDNWIDTDSDTIEDDFDWTTLDHTNADFNGVANPIDVTGATVASGGYSREWCVQDNVPVIKAKTIHIRVTWGNNRQVVVRTVLSQ